MLNTLNSQGIKISGRAPLADIAKSFFQNIVRRDSFDENTHFGHGNTMLVQDEYVYLPDDVTRVDSIDPVTITTIVTSIVKYIKTVRDRKKAGEPITPIQEKVAVLSDKVDKEVQAQTDAQINSEVGGFVTDNSKYLLIGAAAVLLLLIFRK